MRKIRGVSLIELVLFIVVLGIFAASSMGAFMTVLKLNNKPGSVLTAAQLAGARMNVILLQRRVVGVSALTDPCAGGSPPAACTGLSSFATANGYTVSSSISALSGGARTATISVTGTNYATVVERFAQ